jgi:hypothetical protein
VRTLALLSLLALPSCRSVTAPIAAPPATIIAQPADAPPGDPVLQVPQLEGIAVEEFSDHVVLRARLRPRAPTDFYSGSQPGGWCLQWFVDSDHNTSTGYGWGFDSIVDSGPNDPDGAVLLDGQGNVVGTASILVGDDGTLTVTAPIHNGPWVLFAYYTADGPPVYNEIADVYYSSLKPPSGVWVEQTHPARAHRYVTRQILRNDRVPREVARPREDASGR